MGLGLPELTVQQQEPCEGRLSSTVPWERRGEVPLRHPIIAWDSYKHYRDQKKKDEAILTALRLEMMGNVGLLRHNQAIIKLELTILAEGLSVVEPLAPLYQSMWQVLALNMPQKLIEKSKLLGEVRGAIEQLMRTSEIISSRENYRINNCGISNYHTQVQMYDQLLDTNIPLTIKNLEIVVQEL